LAGPVFATARDYTVGNDVTSVAPGDFNGDGKPDLALAGGDTGGVSVMLSNGDGTFQPAKFYATDGNRSSAMVVGDFNSDRLLDLAIVDTCITDINCPQSQVSVLLGHGDGTFGAAQNFGSGGILADSLAVGDFNDDGNVDLVVSNEQASSTCCNVGNIGILFGNGDGTFRPATVALPGGSYPMGVNVSDFNQDGQLDLAVTNQCSEFNCAGSEAGVVAIFLGSGDGTFQSGQIFADGGAFPLSTAAADLNGDGKTDLVVAHRGGGLALRATEFAALVA